MENQPNINPSIDMRRDTPFKYDISDEDKERFYKSVISDKPYEEVVALFDGALKLRFKAMTVQENTDVVNQIVADKQNGMAADNDAYFITIATYRLGLSLVTVNDQVFSTIMRDSFSPSVEHDTYVLARSNVIRNWATPKLSAFLDAFQTFEGKLLKLTTEVQSVNFWKASA